MSALAWGVLGWCVLAIIGTVVLYIGYGFAMSAKGARDRGASQAVVVKVDSAIAFPFVLLDAVLNVSVYSFIALDFRSAYWLTLATKRFSLYNLDPDEWRWRRFLASVFAAFLDGKDPSGDHILGQNPRFSWLD